MKEGCRYRLKCSQVCIERKCRNRRKEDAIMHSISANRYCHERTARWASSSPNQLEGRERELRRLVTPAFVITETRKPPLAASVP